MGGRCYVDHLLQNPQSEAAVIDTKGTFSPLHLRDILALRLRNRSGRSGLRQSGYMYEQKPSDFDLSEEDSLQRATSMLDRVKVMRVFESAGLFDAVSEVAQILESATRNSNESTRPPAKVQKTAVADSEDESGGDDAYNSDNVSTRARFEGDLPSQALLAGLMRSLHRLTVPYNTCILVTNSIVGVHTSSSPQYRRRPEDDVSIFSSTIGKPALGKTFTHLIDTSIFLSSLPKTRDDAEVAYGGDGGTKNFATAGILEVLKDRETTRAGRWAAFDLINGTDIRMIQLRS
ncbi:MAG: hypothetical protein Q9191_005286 [Dirinaria sp. TL-2023a]